MIRYDKIRYDKIRYDKIRYDMVSYYQLSAVVPIQLGSPPTASGHALCRSAWLRFLGIGKQRILRTKRKFRGLDERTINQGISSENMF